MAYQAAKGMHFLHSSGIVHRDLKSLNLLLDAKWNVKVSDFGLTKFREEVQKATVHEAQGSIHWTAPEVLNETVDLDYTLADVYSFGTSFLHQINEPCHSCDSTRDSPMTLAALTACRYHHVGADDARTTLLRHGVRLPHQAAIVILCFYFHLLIPVATERRRWR